MIDEKTLARLEHHAISNNRHDYAEAFRLASEVRRLREENERMRKEVGEKRADADWMNGNIADLRRCLALYREREMVMGWNQE